ncbi:MAG: hypothetical protein PHS73_01900 [Candidatus Peribacteraceae bacterium]|nr:hypothetical protein [Candidatus Peribacteraceae bacterium]
MSTFLSLGLLAVLVLLLVTFAWGFFMDAPFLPTPKRVVREMIRLAGLTGNETVMDLGAGDARVLLAAKKQYPSIRAIGCEKLPFIWALGKCNVLLSRKAVEFRLGDALAQDVGDADCIFLYLFPEIMRTLEGKFDRELKPGTRVVSFVFTFPGRKPVQEVPLPWLGGTGTVRLYEW